jgi:hypothetical protein
MTFGTAVIVDAKSLDAMIIFGIVTSVVAGIMGAVMIPGEEANGV